MHASFTILTYNVWFVQFKFEERARAIFDIVDANEPDAVCLQEVTPPFVDLVKQWLEETKGSRRKYKYVLSGGPESVVPYGVLMLIRTELRPKFQFHELPTTMARRLLTAQLQIPVLESDHSVSTHMPFMLGTVHLESLDTHPVREQQMQIAAGVLEACTDSALVGDFNFCSYRNFDVEKTPLDNDSLERLMPNHVDLWPLLKGEERGFTFDSEVNRMLPQHQPEQMRYDRVVANTPSWHARDIRIVGDERIDEQALAARAGEHPSSHGGGLWPSDHFGLVARLELRDDPPPSTCAMS